jgi:hypothetical protein
LKNWLASEFTEYEAARNREMHQLKNK